MKKKRYKFELIWKLLKHFPIFRINKRAQKA